MAQLDLRAIQRTLTTGDADVLLDVKQDTVMPVKELLEILAKAPIFQVVKLLSNAKAKQISTLMARCESDADFTQRILRVTGTKPQLNPVTNAVHEAFARRRWNGNLRTVGRTLELDTLLYSDTKGAKD